MAGGCSLMLLLSGLQLAAQTTNSKLTSSFELAYFTGQLKNGACPHLLIEQYRA